jgi:hypothetical protein
MAELSQRRNVERPPTLAVNPLTGLTDFHGNRFAALAGEEVTGHESISLAVTGEAF